MTRYDEEQRYERVIERVRDDRLGVLSMDDSIAQDLDGDEVTRMLTALADIGGYAGLLQQVGPLISNLSPGYLDEFAALCRLADALHAKREEAIRERAEEIMAERAAA